MRTFSGQLLQQICEGRKIHPVLTRYPVRNLIWTLVKSQIDPAKAAGELAFVTEMAEFNDKDPWNRPYAANRLQAVRDQENEVLYWKGRVSVEGVPIDLKIFND